MLLNHEVEIARQALASYPAGMPDTAWGSGPLAVPLPAVYEGETPNYQFPSECTRETLSRYG